MLQSPCFNVHFLHILHNIHELNGTVNNMSNFESFEWQFDQLQGKNLNYLDHSQTPNKNCKANNSMKNYKFEVYCWNKAGLENIADKGRVEHDPSL